MKKIAVVSHGGVGTKKLIKDILRLQETENTGKDLTLGDLRKMSDGSIVKMGCSDCEGLEWHQKINGEWVCQWCKPTA